VLLITLVLLVVFSVVAYRLTMRVTLQRHRNQYLIDYQAARYACDSAVKYALATLQDIQPRLVARPNEPDFSDLFRITEEEYQAMLEERAAQIAAASQNSADVNRLAGLYDGPSAVVPGAGLAAHSPNDSNQAGGLDRASDSNEVFIRGPYGPPWPLIAKPKKLQIGTAAVTVEIEDENAKYPLSWALLQDKETEDEVEASFESFCEWMALDPAEVEALSAQLEQVAKLKPWKFERKGVAVVSKKIVATGTRRGSRRRTTKTVSQTKRTIPATVHVADLAKLLHSPLLDTETLARPTIVSQSRKESALKYMGLWGSERVNINTAPRQVLEGAFTFGGNQVAIADDIIRLRRIKPFKNIEELKQALFGYSDSIDKCAKYITTESDFFTIRVTAVSGAAKASAVIAVERQGDRVQKIAVLAG